VQYTSTEKRQFHAALEQVLKNAENVSSGTGGDVIGNISLRQRYDKDRGFVVHAMVAIKTYVHADISATDVDM
jgi:hypothetical protein